MQTRRGRRILSGVTAFILGATAVIVTGETADPLAWPAATKECRPWSYWWWMGSAVDKENLTKELTRYRDAGWGGVHIIPIYGAKGCEPKFIEYLSPQWMEMLRHTVSEARRLGMDVDMTTGSGWCFGGPNVPPREACAQVATKTFNIAAGARLKEKFDRSTVQALVAFSPDGECIDLTGKIGSDGAVDWTAPPLSKAAASLARGSSKLLARESLEQEKRRKMREEIEAKLNTVIIPKIEFNNASLVDVADFFADGSRSADGKQDSRFGINIVFAGGIGSGSTLDKTRITLSLRNVTLHKALQSVCDIAGLKFVVDIYAVLVVPANYAPVCNLLPRREYKIQPHALARVLSANHGEISSEGLKKFFVKAGVPFPEGAAVIYHEGRLFVSNRSEHLDTLEKLLAKLNLLSSNHYLVLALWCELDRGTGKALLRIRGLRRETAEVEAKIDAITIPKIELRDASLADAVKFLAEQSREVDAKRGGLGVRIEIDESLRPALKDAPLITLNLFDVPLHDSLRYVTSIAGVEFVIKPDKVAILSANWWQLKGASKPVTRSYQWKRNLLDPHLGLGAGLVSVGQIRELLTDVGVEFPAGASLTYDASSEKLTIANSPEALDVFEQVLALLEAAATEDDITGGGWRVFAISQKPTSKVKRAAPGGEGHMLNPLYADAIRHWLGRFTDAFARYDGPKPRAQYHDSFEYQVNWSPDLFTQFEKRRGYCLQSELPALLGKEENDHAARVRCDYRETISDMMVEDSMPLWFNWCREHGFLTRNQAHGSPGNLLDLYALADIPETEMFHTDRRPLVAKFASSAAHVAGRNLVASETGTWLKEHFTETLADVQGLLDDLFVSGVNHVIFHGTCYSPDEAGWPGWLFYASTEMNPRNSIWRDVPALAAYIARCQSVLQAGRPDNDVLVYWPIYDVWHKATGLAENLTVHGAGWFGGQPIGKLAEKLWARGFAFDYISDRQLAALKPAGRVIVVPATEHMPLKTIEHLLRLAEGGTTVIFDETLPKDVPGLRELETRRAKLKRLLERAKSRVRVGDAELLLTKTGVAREPMVDHAGLFFIRRALGDGRYYFIANRGDKPVDGWLPLTAKAKSVTLMDPMTGRAGVARMAGAEKVYVQLAPGDSVVLRTFTDRKLDGPRWTYWKPGGDPIALSGPWRVKFLRGGPSLPPAFETARLSSWTELGGEDAQRFAGTALYTFEFDAPATAAMNWWLDLGVVCQSASVRLNGRDLGAALKPPFRVAAGALKPRGNVLEVEVTNVAANRIRDLDRRGVKWRNFYDINFVNIDYKPFDASNWPLANSGLLGPVMLLPMKAFVPR
ncbi:MAG: hypothetical protein HZA88_10690 [Verrucomicrobia bacterium]|nr:hypothetical protein [Verrucomicrobiota bacterium]